jgi:hypothetical protein
MSKTRKYYTRQSKRKNVKSIKEINITFNSILKQKSSDKTSRKQNPKRKSNDKTPRKQIPKRKSSSKRNHKRKFSYKEKSSPKENSKGCIFQYLPKDILNYCILPLCSWKKIQLNHDIRKRYLTFEYLEYMIENMKSKLQIVKKNDKKKDNSFYVYFRKHRFFFSNNNNIEQECFMILWHSLMIDCNKFFMNDIQELFISYIYKHFPVLLLSKHANLLFDKILLLNYNIAEFIAKCYMSSTNLKENEYHLDFYYSNKIKNKLLNNLLELLHNAYIKMGNKEKFTKFLYNQITDKNFLSYFQSKYKLEYYPMLCLKLDSHYRLK